MIRSRSAIRSSSSVMVTRCMNLPARPGRRSGLRPVDGLPNLEALELRVTKIERLVLAGALVGRPEGIGPGPVLERAAAVPDGVRGVERVVVRFRSPEQMELD